MTDKPNWLRRATERAVQSRNFTKATASSDDEDPTFDVWLEQQAQLPDDAWPSRRHTRKRANR